MWVDSCGAASGFQRLNVTAGELGCVCVGGGHFVSDPLIKRNNLCFLITFDHSDTI